MVFLGKCGSHAIAPKLQEEFCVCGSKKPVSLHRASFRSRISPVEDRIGGRRSNIRILLREFFLNIYLRLSLVLGPSQAFKIVGHKRRGM